MRRDLFIGIPLFLVVAAIPVVAPWATLMLTTALGSGLVALGMIILLRGGQISFGHGLFYAGGAYTVAFIAAAGIKLDVVVLLVLGTIMSAIIAATVGLFVVRYRDIFFAMINLALSMVANALLEKLYNITGGSDGLNVPRPTFLWMDLGRTGFESAMFYGSLGLVVIISILVARYLSSPLGMGLEAIKANETRLEYLGVSSRRVLYVGYVISGALAGLGGAITAIVAAHVTPEMSFWTKSGEFVFIAVLGGSGHVAGAFSGAIVFELVRNYAAAFASSFWQAILGAALIAIILFAPSGIVGTLLRKGEAK
ncbi:MULTISPECIES: branched-chain amino acid ABC transporter permease [Agrobacterium]|uniref:Branched-chain amino acid ABC transporter permease n=1 Tax=Agrobacterium rubi TaxID=28099 RepID=A0AAE7US17_9HYPH|nr:MULTISPECIES: branched-chain amino acid ABC transporter permease [Agrobacterium]MBN7807859.1 branched-chain amino acid ABC transporter permease [Agrobacterium rosae]NTE89819.1 branched-chain amino acid ABC transporter permease [Agrobacterium rubi]NTF05331.1 branched-chain amino acid ABC transporter permease [Agrobacterium rubi]NTF39775.1 branched-chain amino acid ABC transporter permease [Agrobacterium rubi]OCJ44915.1 branched-chain amino acid ABC transporter permease [Agrobacterium rubi]